MTDTQNPRWTNELRAALDWYAQQFHWMHHKRDGMHWTTCDRGRCAKTKALLDEEPVDA